jgi:hypothetical protein
MSKPIVHYIRGSEANTGYDHTLSVFALDHPKLGAARIITSRIVDMREYGIFETLNSLYVPVDESLIDDYITE